MALPQWVDDCTRKIGGGRTRKLIEAAGQRGLFPEEVKDLLTRLSSSDNGEGPEGVVINDILNVVLKLNSSLGLTATVEEALSLIEEANLG